MLVLLSWFFPCPRSRSDSHWFVTCCIFLSIVLPLYIDDQFTPLDLYKFEEMEIKVLTSLSKVIFQLYRNLKIAYHSLEGNPMESTEQVISMWASGQTILPGTWKCLLEVLKEFDFLEVHENIQEFIGELSLMTFVVYIEL